MIVASSIASMFFRHKKVSILTVLKLKGAYPEMVERYEYLNQFVASHLNISRVAPD